MVGFNIGDTELEFTNILGGLEFKNGFAAASVGNTFVSFSLQGDASPMAENFVLIKLQLNQENAHVCINKVKLAYGQGRELNWLIKVQLMVFWLFSSPLISQPLPCCCLMNFCLFVGLVCLVFSQRQQLEPKEQQPVSL